MAILHKVYIFVTQVNTVNAEWVEAAKWKWNGDAGDRNIIPTEIDVKGQ